MESVKTSLFDYQLPRELIAAVPATRRQDSRLMVLHRKDQRIEHCSFLEISRFLVPGDLLVANNSKVLRARMYGKRLSTGGRVEFLLLQRTGNPDGKDRWSVICRPAKKLKPGEQVYFANKRVTAKVLHYLTEGEREVEFNCPDILTWLDELGEVPLPPYIVQRRRELQEQERLQPVDDEERYQTVYAFAPGSIAAPTAGLHVTEELLEVLRARGVEFATITLHVGPGTFKPIEVEDTDLHPMHEEQYFISAETADRINSAQGANRRIIAIGTTTVRSLESSANDSGVVQAGDYSTSLMISPGYEFHAVDAMLTNFHLPRSTLLMLVSAFAGREYMLAAYEEAVREKYRFYSYGDAMLIL